MKCPNCQIENPDDHRFCRDCGVKLTKKCPECEAEVLSGDKFCGKCGHDLTRPSEPSPKELSFDEKLNKIQRYLPKGLTEKILSQRDKIEGERKQVTVMFCDMEGFTVLSEKLGPEEMYALMDQVYEILIHKVRDYDGTVNEMTGDGIMALFGAPIALEDAPQRGLRSALAIHREVKRFNERMTKEKEIPPIRMRIGIHSGPVVVGTLGNDLRVEFKAVGDTVNLAARMEGLAEPGTTLVTEDTFRFTEGLFRFEALGPREVKGWQQPVRVYQVIAPSSRRTRFDVSAERGLTPFVGRERELEIVMDAYARAKGGRGQAISVVAEAGVGKSRLLYEFRKSVSNEDVTFLEGKCLSYSRDVSYHPIIDILKGNFEIHDEDDDLEVRDKVGKGLKAIGADVGTTLPYLLELLSVKDSGLDRIRMSPEMRRYRILEALTHIVLKGSKLRPLIVAIEDLHWLDKSSEESLKALLDHIPGSPILLLFTYRPEFLPPWGGKSYHSQVMVNRLSSRESLSMLSYLFGTDAIASDLQELILEKTEGVPFFIEELIKSLKDLQLVERGENGYALSKRTSVAIPSTIRDVIMARVDVLPEGAKELLQAGSVIEREFSYSLIKRVASIAEQDLLAHLSVLKDTELLFERGIYPNTTLIFKHSLTREVVYDSLLQPKRRRLHEEIGKAIEELYIDNLTDHYEALTYHYSRGESHEKAAEYSRLAAKKAEKAASLFKAIFFARQRVACLERLPQTEEVLRKLIDSRTALGLYLTQMDQNEAKQAIDPIIDDAIRLRYNRRLCQLYMIQGSYEVCVTEDFEQAMKALESALRLSEESRDIVTQVLASFYYASALASNCQFEKAREFFLHAYEIDMAAGSFWGASAVLSTMAWIALIPEGRVQEAFEATHKAVELAEESGDVFSRSTAHASHGYSCFFKGWPEEARRHFLKGFELSQFMPHLWYAHMEMGLGTTYSELGDFSRSKAAYERGISVLANHGLQPSFLALGRIGRLRAAAMNGERDSVLESLPLLLKSVKKRRESEGWFHVLLGETYLYLDDLHSAEAEEGFLKAIEVSQISGTRFSLGQAHRSYAELFRREGDRVKAREHLDKAIEIIRQCGADGWVAKYEQEMAALS